MTWIEGLGGIFIFITFLGIWINRNHIGKGEKHRGDHIVG